MKADRQRDAEMDSVLASTLRRTGTSARAGDCPTAGDLAAFVEGGLSPAEKNRFEEHVSTCDGCQQTLAAIGRMPPAEAGGRSSDHDTVPAMAGWLRWLIPAGGAAALLLAYIVVNQPNPAAPDMQVARSQAPAPVPSSAVESRGGTPGPPRAPLTASGGAREPRSDKEKSRTADVARGSAPPKGEEAQATVQKVQPHVAAEIASQGAAQAATGEQARPRDVPAQNLADAATRQKAVVDNLAFFSAPAKPGVEGQQSVSAKGQAAAPVQAPAGLVPTTPPPPASAAGVAGQPPAPVRIGTVAESVAFRAAAPVAQNVPGSAVVVVAPDARTKWRFERGTAIWRSTDAGTSWQLQRPAAVGEVLAAFAPALNTCWAVGREGLVLVTADGEHWESRAFAEKVDLVGVTARDGRAATVTTRDGRRFTTADGGLTWQVER